jgi:hypothetical protein
MSPVVLGNTTTLTYGAVTDATSCTPSLVSGEADPIWTGTSSADLMNGTGSPKVSTARTAVSVYRMSCTGTGGTTAIDQIVAVTDPCGD